MTAVHDPVDELAIAEQRVADLRARLADTYLDVATDAPVEEKTVEQLRDDVEQAEVEDFDRFWAAQDHTGLVLHNVHGMDLHLPRSVPLIFEVQARRLQRSERPDDAKLLLDLLFGRGTSDELVKRGVTGEQFNVILMWGSANASGQRMTLPQARAEYQRLQLADAQGKSTDTGGLWRDVVRFWALIEADLAREYQLEEEGLAALSVRRFLILLRGLSGEALFRHAMRNRPREITGDDATRQAISRM